MASDDERAESGRGRRYCETCARKTDVERVRGNNGPKQVCSECSFPYEFASGARLRADGGEDCGRAIVHKFVVDYWPQGVAKTYHVADGDGTPICGADVDSEPEELRIVPEAQGAICDDCGGAESLLGNPECPNCGQAITRQHRKVWLCYNENCRVRAFEVTGDGA